MRRIAIFTDDPGWHGARLRAAFARYGFSPEYISLTACRLSVEPGHLPVHIPGFEHALPDAAFVRGVPGGSLQEVVFYLDILHALQALDIPVYNDARAIERSVDKAMTSFLLQQAGLPTPPTWVARDRDYAVAIAARELSNGHSLLSKPLFGSQGEGIRRIDNSEDLLGLAGDNGMYYLQRFVHCAGGRYADYRIFVVNGRVIGAMRRCGISWLNNVAQGARCEAVHLDEAMEQLAIAAVQTLQMDYGGVDIIATEDGGFTIIEVNSIPAWKGLQSVCSFDIADCLVEDLIIRHLRHLPTSQKIAACLP
ncbi:MAG: ATP-grasp domain-containing protein [Gammaproteobacteria bacterium]